MPTNCGRCVTQSYRKGISVRAFEILWMRETETDDFLGHWAEVAVHSRALWEQEGHVKEGACVTKQDWETHTFCWEFSRFHWHSILMQTRITGTGPICKMKIRTFLRVLNVQWLEWGSRQGCTPLAMHTCLNKPRFLKQCYLEEREKKGGVRIIRMHRLHVWTWSGSTC